MSLAEPTADVLAVAGLVEELRAATASDPAAKERALAYYEQGVAKDPDNILAQQWLASIYLDINRPDEALEHFQRVIELDPLNTLALAALASAYFATGDYEKAQQHLYKVQFLFPELGMAYRYLSFNAFQTGRLDMAAFWMGRAVEIDPNPLEIYMLIGNYVAFGWADEALDAAERYRQLNDGVDISRMVQARLDHDFEALATEAKLVFAETGESEFAALAAWSDALAGNCRSAIRTLERQYPSLKGEVIAYLDAGDSGDAVLLAHCNNVVGNEIEAQRLISTLLAAEVLSDEAVRQNPALRIVRVAARAVGGDVAAALTELALMDPDKAPLAITSVGLPVDELPVFSALYDEEPFQKYAANEHYRIAQQARMLAAGETVEEIRAEVEAAGYTLSGGL
jgi:tetratricopeptide (TPR) repeat protein